MILVEIKKDAGNREGDWVVRNGPGGAILSTHRLKDRAVEEAKQEARKRNTSVRFQNTHGQWAQGPGYGGG